MKYKRLSTLAPAYEYATVYDEKHILRLGRDLEGSGG